MRYARMARRWRKVHFIQGKFGAGTFVTSATIFCNFCILPTCPFSWRRLLLFTPAVGRERRFDGKAWEAFRYAQGRAADFAGDGHGTLALERGPAAARRRLRPAGVSHPDRRCADPHAAGLCAFLPPGRLPAAGVRWSAQ